MTALPWYHKTTIYQIYPRSFYDSNQDGIGDIQEIVQKLDYIKGAGIRIHLVLAVLCLASGGLRLRYFQLHRHRSRIRNDERRVAIDRRSPQPGMKIIFDMVMNHTSSEHPWFKESRSSRENPKADWYLWKDPLPLF